MNNETPLARAATANHAVVQEHIDGYEYDDGESAAHTPSDFERLLIADAIEWLLADPEFVRTFCAWQALAAPAPQPAITQEISQFLTDVVTAAGLLEHGKRDKALAARIGEAAFRLRTENLSPSAAYSDLERECAAVDDLLHMIGLDPEQCRTDGGAVNMARVRSLVAERSGAPDLRHEVERALAEMSCCNYNSAAERLRHALEIQCSSVWQPIESAPKGELVLLHSTVKKGRPMIGDWADYCGINQPKFDRWCAIPAVQEVQG